MKTIGVPSLYKRMYDIRINEAQLKENVAITKEQLQVPRLGHYHHGGLITIEEARVALVNRLMTQPGIPGLFSGYWLEWRATISHKALANLARQWAQGSNTGTPMEEIDALQEAQKPKQLYDEPRTGQIEPRSHSETWAYKR